MSIIKAAGSGEVSTGFYPYSIDQSLRFEDGSSAYLNRTPSSSSNRKTWTWSGWAKRGNLDVTTNVFGSGPDGDNQCAMIFASSGLLQFRNEVSNSIKIVQSSLVSYRCCLRFFKLYNSRQNEAVCQWRKNN